MRLFYITLTLLLITSTSCRKNDDVCKACIEDIIEVEYYVDDEIEFRICDNKSTNYKPIDKYTWNIGEEEFNGEKVTFIPDHGGTFKYSLTVNCEDGSIDTSTIFNKFRVIPNYGYLYVWSDRIDVEDLLFWNKDYTFGQAVRNKTPPNNNCEKYHRQFPKSDSFEYHVKNDITKEVIKSGSVYVEENSCYELYIE